MYDSLSDLSAALLDAADIPDDIRALAQATADAGDDAFAIMDVVTSAQSLPLDLIDAVQDELDDGLYDGLDRAFNSMSAALTRMRAVDKPQS